MRFEKKSDFFGRGGGLVPLWHFVGSKSHLIIDQKSRWNARYYRFVVKKRSIFGGGGGGLGEGSWKFGPKQWGNCSILYACSKETIVAPAIKITLYYQPNKSKKCLRKIDWEGDGEGGGVLSICSIFCYQNNNRLSAKKLDIIGKKNRLSCGREGGILDYLIIELKKSKKYLILYRRKRKENKNLGEVLIIGLKSRKNARNCRRFL